MILVDTGPLVALIDAGQGDIHQRCVETYQNIREPMLTTWPCWTEAMYFLSDLRGWKGQEVLWQFLERQVVSLHSADQTECHRIKVLMETYQDIPMDLADASLVSVAERLSIQRIFTLDSDFYVYRIKKMGTFEVIPAGA